MSAEPLTDEQLKDQAIKQALAGDDAGARKTASQIRGSHNLRQAWQAMVLVAAERKNVRAVIDAISSCPDEKLLYCHDYRELPLRFIDAGDVDGAIEIARTMSGLGWVGLLGAAFYFAKGGDLVRAKDALSHVPEELGTLVLPKLDEYSAKARAQQNRPEAERKGT